MTPVWDVAPHPQATAREGPGSFREHDIEPFPAGMQPPPWPEVPDDARLDHRRTGLARRRRGDDRRVARRPARPLRADPPVPGRQRPRRRLILNLLLVRLGYPPAIIYKGDRSRYLAALRRADGGDYGPLGELLARAVLDNLYKFVVPAVAGPARLVPLPALATEQLSANALRVAAIRGRLKAGKAADGSWRSSKAWVDEYAASRYKRG